MPEADDVRDVDASLVAGEPLPSTRVPLDRDRIISAAIAFIDEQGLPGLTMRRLGDRLGVEAMSLYRYVPGKEDLLDAVVESLVLSMEYDDEVLTRPENGWQDFLQRLAHGVRRVALLHPKAFPLVASRPPEAPWLRPPLRSIGWVENFLDALVSQGFTDEAAVGGYRAFTSFLLGHLLLEVATHGGDVGPLDVIDDGSPDYAELEDFPAVKRLRPALSEDHAAVEFEESLENLLERMALIRSENNSDRG
jgi:AcrR family transcriptional regulator